MGIESLVKKAYEVLERDLPVLRDYSGGMTGYVDADYCPACFEPENIKGEIVHDKDCLLIEMRSVIQEFIKYYEEVKNG